MIWKKAFFETFHGFWNLHTSRGLNVFYGCFYGWFVEKPRISFEWYHNWYYIVDKFSNQHIFEFNLISFQIFAYKHNASLTLTWLFGWIQFHYHHSLRDLNRSLILCERKIKFWLLKRKLKNVIFLIEKIFSFEYFEQIRLPIAENWCILYDYCL